MANNNHRSLSTAAKAGIGAGIAALAAAAAGAYYFYGSKHAAKNRKAMKSWAVKAKGEVMEKLENLKDVSEKSYHKAVNDVVAKYKKLKNIDPKELAALTAELRNSWARISAHVQAAAGRAKSKTARRRPRRA